MHATPKDGSVIYGFEAFLCRAGTTFSFDADIRPTLTGKCITKPLSPASDDYKQVQAAPPFTAADTTFKVGVGVDTYETKDGQMTTITCGAGNPCTLVLKLQFPDGFGFRAIDLSYA